MRERRLHVRIKPTPSSPATAVRELDALMHESLAIIDISVGGMALADVTLPVGTTTKLKLALTGHGEYFVDVEVRWSANGATGVTFVAPSPAAAQAIQRYVAESPRARRRRLTLRDVSTVGRGAGRAVLATRPAHQAEPHVSSQPGAGRRPLRTE